MTEASTPDDDGDILHGAGEIAYHIEETVRRTNYLLERRMLPAFKQAGRWRMRKSTYRRRLEALEASASS